MNRFLKHRELKTFAAVAATVIAEREENPVVNPITGLCRQLCPLKRIWLCKCCAKLKAAVRKATNNGADACLRKEIRKTNNGIC